MDTIGRGPACSLEGSLATFMALSVLCGSALAQSVEARVGSNSSPSVSGSLVNLVNSADAPDARGIPDTSDEVESPVNGGAMQRWLRPVGAGSNGAPRYTRSDVEVAPWRNLPGLQAAGALRAEVTEFSSRWWYSTGPTDIGFGVGTIALIATPMGGGVTADAVNSGIALASSPTLSLGIRRRTSAASTVYADATRTRTIGVNGIDSYSGKVGVEWKSAESRWSVAYSGLGMRLSAESRMTLSLRKGGLGIYMRSRF